MKSAQIVAFAFLRDHPEEAAAILDGRAAEEAAAILEETPAEEAAAVIARMAPLSGSACFGALSPGKGAEIAEILPLQAVAALVRRLDAESRESLLGAMSGPAAEPLRRLLRYPDDSVGAVMDPRILALPPDLRVEEAVAHLRRMPRWSIYYIYITDRDQKLVGVVNVRGLLFADPGEILRVLMRSPVARLSARDDRRSILHHPAWHLYHALPVVDEGEVFVGAVRYETLRRLEREARPEEGPSPVFTTAMRLGELTWVALVGLFAGFAGPPATPIDAAGRAREGSR